MTYKINVSLVKLLVNFWLKTLDSDRPIYFTSFITRIADSMGLLDAHSFEYITSPRNVITESTFINAHILKRGSRGELKMIYPSHTAEVLLPCERRRLYVLRTLTIKLDREVRSQNVAGTGRVTRSMSRAAQMEQGG